jgi:hypothetical protein
MSSDGAPAITEIAITGANCPWCFNETVDRLRAEPGVVAVHGSLGAHCLRVHHDGTDSDRLLGIVRRHLHADDVSSSEHVMVEVDARVARLRCTHRARPGVAGEP